MNSRRMGLWEYLFPGLTKHRKRNRTPLKERILLHKRALLTALAVVCAAALLGGICSYIITKYRVTELYVEGNVHYTDEEIASMVLGSGAKANSLYLSLKYRNKSIEGIPFIEKMDVNIVAPDTVRINVYEKALAGYIKYLDRYLYFDREGIIVESSLEETGGIPLVMGLDFAHAVLYESLPVENKAVFGEILDITQLLEKYDLSVDRIYFDDSFDVYLYFDDVEVSVGQSDGLEEKIMQLKYILPSLAGRRGILKMRDYNASSNHISFEEIGNP